MKHLFNIILMAAIGLFACSPTFAVSVDGIIGAGEYSDSFTAPWYNAHAQPGSQYQKGGGQTTTVYWESTATNFFLGLQISAGAKSMIWGTGFTDADYVDYYQHWCSPTDGEPAAEDGSNCGHHKDGFAKFKSDKTDYGTMTGSEKFIFGDGAFKEKDGFDIFDEKLLDGVLANLAGTASGDYYGPILDYADSVDWVLVNRATTCDTTNCDANDIPMAFEIMFGPLTDAVRNALISDITTNGLEVHLSPEAIPVPAAVWLFGSGLLGLFGVAKRKKAA